MTVRGQLKASLFRGSHIEILARRKDQDQELPGRTVHTRIQIADRDIRVQGDTEIGQWKAEFRRDRVIIHPHEGTRLEAPAEYLFGELEEIGDPGNRPLLRLEGILVDARMQQLLSGIVSSVENCAGAHQCHCRDDQTCRPDEAQPFEVRKNGGWNFGHGGQLDSGQRYTSPSGSMRVARTS